MKAIREKIKITRKKRRKFSGEARTDVQDKVKFIQFKKEIFFFFKNLMQTNRNREGRVGNEYINHPRAYIIIYNVDSPLTWNISWSNFNPLMKTS